MNKKIQKEAKIAIKKYVRADDEKILINFVKKYPNKNLVEDLEEMLVEATIPYDSIYSTESVNKFIKFYKLVPQFLTKDNINDNPRQLILFLNSMMFLKDEYDDDDAGEYQQLLRTYMDVLQNLVNHTIDMGIDLNYRDIDDHPINTDLYSYYNYDQKKDAETAFFFALQGLAVYRMYPKVSITSASEINMKNINGEDALMLAVKNKNIDLVKKLLDLGFNPLYEVKLKNQSYNTALSLAQGRGNAFYSSERETEYKNDEMVKLMKKCIAQPLLDSDITTFKGELLHPDIINYEIIDYL